MSVREHWINVRVNQEELARIREKQKELGIRNTGAYMRKMAMNPEASMRRISGICRSDWMNSGRCRS